MAGERLPRADLTARGLSGDRIVQVRDRRHIITSRTHHRLLGLSATLAPDGTPLVNGRPWTSSDAAAAVKLRGRCVMTTFDPDTLVQDLGVLRRIAQVFDGRMAIDSAVVRGGRIAIGDPVELVEPDDINSPAASSTSPPAAGLSRRA